MLCRYAVLSFSGDFAHFVGVFCPSSFLMKFGGNYIHCSIYYFVLLTVRNRITKENRRFFLICGTNYDYYITVMWNGYWLELEHFWGKNDVLSALFAHTWAGDDTITFVIGTCLQKNASTGKKTPIEKFYKSSVFSSPEIKSGKSRQIHHTRTQNNKTILIWVMHICP